MYIYTNIYTQNNTSKVFFFAYIYMKRKQIYIYIHIYIYIRGQAFMSTPKNAREEAKMSR